MAQAQRPACRQKAVRDDGTPLCHHDAPMYRFGTTWRCAVRVRERNMARYDNDPFYRIPKRLKSNARKRRERIEARKRQLAEGGFKWPATERRTRQT